MKKIFSLVALIALSSVPMLAQTVDCNASVVDAAKILSPSDINQIQTALPALERESVDAHVITYNLSANDTQENFLSRMQKSCNSWQNRAGGLKGNILVFMVSMTPKHLIGIYPGPNYQNTSLNFNVRAEIKKNSVGPFLASGNFGLGLANGIRQATQRISAVQTASLPAQKSGSQTVIIKNSKPTDLSGFFTFLKLLLGLVFIGGIVWLVIYYGRIHRANKLAQLDAISARNAVTSLLARLTDALREKAALGVKVSASQAELDGLASEFANLSGSLQYDPSDNTLSKEAYENISSQYNSILRELKGISTEGDSATKKARKKAAKNASYGSVAEESAPEVETPSFREPNYAPTPSYSSTPVQQGSTTIIHEDHYHDDSSGLLTGVLLGEALSRPSYSEPVYREPAYTSPSYSEPSRDDSQASFQDDSSNYQDSNDSQASFQDDSSSFSDDSSSSFDSGGGSDF